MTARGSFRRRCEWALILGGVAVACGGKTTSYTGGTTSLSGGTAGSASGGSNPSGGAATTGGASNPAGGASTDTGGTDSGGTSTGGAQTGGTSSGGSATGGSVTGGTRNALCDVVPSLPAMGTKCSTPGESQCDASGNRCICERGIWYCNTACPATEPTPATVCERGAYCNYAPGVTCACIEYFPEPNYPYPDGAPASSLLWMCVGISGCPAELPSTGAGCDTAIVGGFCDYPNRDSGIHLMCNCSIANPDGGAPTWTCLTSAACYATQPAYDLTQPCTGPAICTYSTPPYHCGCPVQSGQGTWVCF